MVSILPQKDRVAYATVNGQTGLVVADIPIDPKRYLLGSLLLAIPIFALLAWSAFLQPSSLVMTTLLLSLLSIGVYCYECVSIHQKIPGQMTGAKCSSNRRKLLLQTNRKPLKPSRSQPQNESAWLDSSALCCGTFVWGMVPASGIGSLLLRSRNSFHGCHPRIVHQYYPCV